jgi:multiple sugar transport system substrate-binding protein
MILRSNLRDGEGAYFDKDNRPVVESPRFVRAFELAKAVREAKLDANVRAWTPEGTKVFQRGLIATHIGGAWFSSYIAALSGTKSGGSWNVANLPGDAFAYMGGTYYAVPKASKNKELAWEFVRFMTLGKANQLNAFRVQNAFPALLEAMIDPFFDQPLDFLGGQKARLVWREAAYRIPGIRISEYDGLAFELIEEELRNVLENGKDIPTALREARIALEKKIASDMRRIR